MLVDLPCLMNLQVSVTFDPFMTMSVPIPINLRQLPVFFVPKEPETLPTKVNYLPTHLCVYVCAYVCMYVCVWW
jgi:hypothetical protein